MGGPATTGDRFRGLVAFENRFQRCSFAIREFGQNAIDERKVAECFAGIRFIDGVGRGPPFEGVVHLVLGGSEPGWQFARLHPDPDGVLFPPIGDVIDFVVCWIGCQR